MRESTWCQLVNFALNQSEIIMLMEQKIKMFVAKKIKIKLFHIKYLVYCCLYADILNSNFVCDTASLSYFYCNVYKTLLTYVHK